MIVPIDDRARYQDRKGDTSTNVLATCDPNLRFTYVLPGWDGSTSDPRIYHDALRRPNGLRVTRNKKKNMRFHHLLLLGGVIILEIRKYTTYLLPHYISKYMKEIKVAGISNRKPTKRWLTSFESN
ncbi:uncharacterized protein LOC141705890 [Apium graveolens]|uniref:uncharacterized protein LOC141705890 n=1 Tax=Apium graveolens TaxID=4045 RepID=UPI003D79D09B